jgi:hypothetical protein
VDETCYESRRSVSHKQGRGRVKTTAVLPDR